jgi:hypothetical protein
MALRERKFWNTRKGALLQLNRRKAQQVYIDVPGALESKTAKKLANAISFQDHVRKQMTALGRVRPFRAPVAIEIHFTPSIDRPPPAIHSLAKYYLDLLQWPAGGSANDKSRLLLEDDRQVKALICTYWLGVDHQNPSVRLRITTMNNFVRDLQLFKKVRLGDFTELSDDGLRRSAYADAAEDWEIDSLDDPLEQLQEHIRDKDAFVQARSVEAYEVHRMFLQQLCQEKFLTKRELAPDALAFLLSPYAGRRTKNPHQNLNSLVASMGRQWHQLIGIDLGPSAVRPGEGDLFKKAVRTKLADVRQKEKLMNPLLTTIGVTIVYVPPKNANGIDLPKPHREKVYLRELLAVKDGKESVAKLPLCLGKNIGDESIITFVHEELHPPSTIAHASKAYHAVLASSDEWAESIRAELKSLNRLPQHQVSRYQIFELPRCDTDSDDGNVHLIIHGGLGSLGPWNDADDVIRKWEQAVAHS